MENTSISRRKLVTGVAAFAAYAPFVKAQPLADVAGANKFMTQWDAAWAAHNADAMAALLTEDAVTVNRFGTLLPGREATRKALAFLHGDSGPFGHSKFPALEVLGLRSVAGVMILQTKWQNPVMNPDGKTDPVKVSDMIVTFVLVKSGKQWKATQVDLHNVEKMNLPYSSAGQKD